MFDSMMHMSMSTAAVLGLVVLIVVVAVFYIALRVIGRRVQDDEEHPG